jgi:hypothetical protein
VGTGTTSADAIERLRAAERGEAVVAPGPQYREGQPVWVEVVKRGHRYDIGDAGEAVRLAGRPDGWLEVAEAVVETDALNVNRRGVVFVQAVEGRNIAGLAGRVAEMSALLYAELLEAADD